MRVVVVGGGMVGLTLARLLRARGGDPVVLERAPAGAWAPRGFMLGYQGYDTVEELGILDGLRAAGRDVGTGPNGVPIGIAVDYRLVMAALAEDVLVAHGESVVELVRDGDRVTGVVTDGPGGRARVDADLVVACDGRESAVRDMAGIEARYSPLNDAYLTFLSAVSPEQLFGFRYMSDGGMITMLGWPEGSTGSRRVDKVGERAAKAPGLELFRHVRRAAARGARDRRRRDLLGPGALRRAAPAAVPALVGARRGRDRRLGAHLRPGHRGRGRYRTAGRPRPGRGDRPRPRRGRGLRELRHLARAGRAPLRGDGPGLAAGWATSPGRSTPRSGPPLVKCPES